MDAVKTLQAGHGKSLCIFIVVSNVALCDLRHNPSRALKCVFSLIPGHKSNNEPDWINQPPISPMYRTGKLASEPIAANVWAASKSRDLDAVYAEPRPT
ncbi:hypothetical protein BN2364_4327 [Alloalcanivorax xenomutans]|nr:hypothetical protein BN2364_4327 [Alloalcanivorax xenomutans]